MSYRSEGEIYTLVKRFEERSLPKSEWTHAAHLTVGLFYCIHHSFGVAKNLISDGIYWLNDTHGTPNTETSGYHETLTVFWLMRVAQFIKANAVETDLTNLTNKLIAELCDSKLPFESYSRAVLFSREARLNFVEPDLHQPRILPSGCTLVAEAV